MNQNKKIVKFILVLIASISILGMLAILRETLSDADLKVKEVKSIETNIIDETQIVQTSQTVQTTPTAQNLIKVNQFVDTPTFLKEVNNKNTLPAYELGSEIQGIVVPHHLVAHEQINSMYQSIAGKVRPDLIVLIAPNHFGLGAYAQIAKGTFVTAENQWVTSDEELSEELIYSGLFEQASEELLLKEHGCGVHFNYIGHYFKDVPVLTILLQEKRISKGLPELTTLIHEQVGERQVLYIASIDFSHYLPLEVSNDMDNQTQKYIETNDLESLVHLSNDHIDSPSTYYVWSSLLTLQEPTSKVTIVDRGNSAYCLKDLNLKETTSYFFIVSQTP